MLEAEREIPQHGAGEGTNGDPAVGAQRSSVGKGDLSLDAKVTGDPVTGASRDTKRAFQVGGALDRKSVV